MNTNEEGPGDMMEEFPGGIGWQETEEILREFNERHEVMQPQEAGDHSYCEVEVESDTYFPLSVVSLVDLHITVKRPRLGYMHTL